MYQRSGILRAQSLECLLISFDDREAFLLQELNRAGKFLHVVGHLYAKKERVRAIL